VKKGRHRRFVEARELKRSTGPPRHHLCGMCAAPKTSTRVCLAEEDRYDEILGFVARTSFNEEDPLAAES